MSYVVAIAAPPGGGKSSLFRKLAATVQDSAMLHFDGYERATERPVDEIVEAMTAGTDYADLVSPMLARDLDALKQGRAIIDPLTHLQVPPKKYIFFEMPLGREHRPSARYIDLVVWIDIPLDVALARKLRDFTDHFLHGDRIGEQTEFVGWLDGYLTSYLRGVRQTLLIQRQTVRADADIFIDGTDDLNAMAARAARDIRARLP